MAKLSANGIELHRINAPALRAILSVRSNGVVLIRRATDTGWKVYQRKPRGEALQDWADGWSRRAAGLAA